MITRDPSLNPLLSGIRAPLIRFVRELIAIPSPSGREERIIRRIRQEMERLGYDRIRTDAMGNLTGQVGSGRRTIVLDGHCDTVEKGQSRNWEIDPFRGQCAGGIIRGLGAVDQKGGLAAAIYAGHLVKKTGIPSGITLLVAATVLEEPFEGLSWDHLIGETGLQPEAVVLTEPTGLDICIGHRGRMEFCLTTGGKTSHVANPHLGENAIYKMAPIIGEIEKLNRQMPDTRPLGKGTVTISRISSTAPSRNAVADSATLILDRRLTVGETPQGSLAQLAALPAVRKSDARVTVTRRRAISYTGAEFEVPSAFPGWVMDPSDPLVKRGIRAGRVLFGRELTCRPWHFSTNGVSTRGRHNIPTIGLGPGDDTLAHTPAEALPLTDLLLATAFYTRLIRDWS